MPGNGATGMATWESTKKQAADLLGLKLEDRDVTNIPMLAADPYGNFIPGAARGLPQYVTDSGLVEGNRAAPVPVPANVKHFDTPFLTDIAHNADPSPQDTDNNPAHAAGRADAGRRQRRLGRLREPARRDLRRRDAQRALHRR